MSEPTYEDCCGDRGPRIGSEMATCWRPQGHDGLHQAHISWLTRSGVVPMWTPGNGLMRSWDGPIASDNISLIEQRNYVVADLKNILKEL